MKALIIKELREHTRLALAALAIMTLGYVRAQWDLLPSQAWLSVTRRSFLMVATLGGAGFMLGLGFLQTHLELRNKSWAFLLHRPVPRDRLFLAKAAAALLLFLGAIVLPTVVAAAWCAWPGSIAAPFTAAMLVPASVDLLCAMPYYFAGVVMGLWQARFSVTRALPIAGALVVSVLAHKILDEVWWVLLVAVAATAWLGVVSRNLFVGATESPGRAAPARLMLIITAWIGVAVLQLALEPFVPDSLNDGGAVTRNTETQEIMVARSGELVVANMRNHQVESIANLEGEILRDGLAEGGVWLHSLQASHAGFSRKRLGGESLWGRESYRRDTRFLRVAQLDEPYLYEWYFDREAGRFVAFDPKSSKRMGSLGPDGFLEHGGAPFVGTPIRRLSVSKPVLVFEGGIYRVSWNERTVEPVATSDGAPIIAMGEIERSDGIPLTVFWTETHVELFDMGKHKGALPIAQGLDASSFEVGYVEDTEELYIWYTSEEPEILAYHKIDGRPLRRVAVPPAAEGGRYASAATHGLRAVAVLPPVATAVLMTRSALQMDAWSPALHIEARVVGAADRPRERGGDVCARASAPHA